MRRAFVAIDLPDAVRSSLAVLQFLLPIPRKVEPEHFHLTLTFLGEVQDPALEAAHEAFQAIRAPGFDLGLSGVDLFGGAKPRVVWAGVDRSEPLMRLQAKVDHAARAAGIAVEGGRYVPHVTLGRIPAITAEETMRLERAVVAQTGFRAGPFAVRDFVLYESRPSPKGPRYDELARYPLT